MYRNITMQQCGKLHHISSPCSFVILHSLIYSNCVVYQIIKFFNLLQRTLTKEEQLQETNVRRINAKVWQQAMKGNTAVNHDGHRVFRAKTVHGQLKVKHSDGRWHNATHVDIS